MRNDYDHESAPRCVQCGAACFGGCSSGDDHWCEECCRPETNKCENCRKEIPKDQWMCMACAALFDGERFHGTPEDNAA